MVKIAHEHDPELWIMVLEQLILECRKTNKDLRFGQMVYNAISKGWDLEDFHQRLFYIEDKELAEKLKSYLK